mgnify:CR=1 FL=1
MSHLTPVQISSPGSFGTQLPSSCSPCPQAKVETLESLPESKKRKTLFRFFWVNTHHFFFCKSILRLRAVIFFSNLYFLIIFHNIMNTHHFFLCKSILRLRALISFSNPYFVIIFHYITNTLFFLQIHTSSENHHFFFKSILPDNLLLHYEYIYIYEYIMNTYNII